MPTFTPAKWVVAQRGDEWEDRLKQFIEWLGEREVWLHRFDNPIPLNQIELLIDEYVKGRMK
jgi:hypothetical protein